MRKLKYLILLTAIIVLCGCINITGGEMERLVAEYTIVNSLSKTIYYETVYTLIEISEDDNSKDKYNYDFKKQGEIDAGKYQELGKTSKFGNDEDTDYSISSINIYSDLEHKKLLYRYKIGDAEAKNIFIFNGGEEFKFPEVKNRVIFNMTEDKIIK